MERALALCAATIRKRKRRRCEHCKTGRVAWDRCGGRLCKPCWDIKSVRRKYGSLTSRHGQRGVADGFYKGGEPAPTDALPGTEAKVLVMIERASRKEKLFSKRDAVPT